MEDSKSYVLKVPVFNAGNGWFYVRDMDGKIRSFEEGDMKFHHSEIGNPTACVMIYNGDYMEVHPLILKLAITELIPTYMVATYDSNFQKNNYLKPISKKDIALQHWNIKESTY